MFKTIDPTYHRDEQTSIDLLVDLIRARQDISLTSEELQRATFILAEDKDWGLYGGALLCKKPVKSLHPQIRRILSTFLPHQKEVWRGVVCLDVEEGPSFSERETTTLFQHFYHNLLENLVVFGMQKEARFICLTLSPLEQLKSKRRGCWSYLFEVKPKYSFDGLFHGILSLPVRSSTAYKTPSKIWGKSVFQGEA